MNDLIEIRVNGAALRVIEGTMLASALMNRRGFHIRRSIGGEPRGPMCGMGICFECRATVNSRPHIRTCQVVCTPGMEVLTDE